jgi:hypothetical protein
LICRCFENGGLNWRGVWLEFAEFMVAPKTTENRDRLMDPWWRKARIGARLIQKREEGKAWTARDKRLAKMLAEDPGVTNRLLDQAWWSLRAWKNGDRLLVRQN